MDPRRLKESPDVSEDLRAAVQAFPKAQPLSMVTQHRMRHRVAGIAALATASTATLWYAAAAFVAVVAAVSGTALVLHRKAASSPAPHAQEASLSAAAATPLVTSTVARVVERAPPPASERTPTARRTRLALGQPVPATQDLAAETALLVRAQQLLASSPKEALATADEHRQKYRTGALAAERELLAAQALIALERPDEAAGRLRLLLAGQSGAIYAKRAQRLLDKR